MVSDLSQITAKLQHLHVGLTASSQLQSGFLTTVQLCVVLINRFLNQLFVGGQVGLVVFLCHDGSLRCDYRYCTNFDGQSQVVWCQTVVEKARATDRVPPPLYVSATLTLETLGKNVCAVGVDDLQTCRTGRNVAAVRARITHTLGVVNGVHTQLQLRLIGVPAWLADQQLVVLGLDHLAAQVFQLEAKATAVALGDAVLAGRKPISH